MVALRYVYIFQNTARILWRCVGRAGALGPPVVAPKARSARMPGWPGGRPGLSHATAGQEYQVSQMGLLAHSAAPDRPGGLSCPN